MTQLLEQALEWLRELPEAEQDLAAVDLNGLRSHVVPKRKPARIVMSFLAPMPSGSVLIRWRLIQTTLARHPQLLNDPQPSLSLGIAVTIQL
jgi:hypothetical protein